jgi:alpha-D-ribose 1-methylphosphonate 5-triphosphate diphosphatase
MLKARNIPLATHDDTTEADVDLGVAAGANISEFPTTPEAARYARSKGMRTVAGAPNVVRGGSHTGCPTAADMAQKGICTILASDYYYPALLEAPFRLARDKRMPFEKAWALVSENPARALGLADRGTIELGKRADLILVDPQADGPRLVATIANGDIAYLSDWKRLKV